MSLTCLSFEHDHRFCGAAFSPFLEAIALLGNHLGNGILRCQNKTTPLYESRCLCCGVSKSLLEAVYCHLLGV
jgi:hypothetical protein